MWAFARGAQRLTMGLLLLAGSAGCTQTPETQATRSLRGSSDVSFVCTAQVEGNLVGRPLDACPAYRREEQRRLFALATQQETGEIAVVDLSLCQPGGDCVGRVQDLEHTQPGVNFLPVGGQPVAVASTPGGVASFVAVAEPGRAGIFALPTSCVGPRPDSAAYRDLRTWPACRLPAAPGSMEVVVDGLRLSACDSDEEASGGGTDECPADLSQELSPPGRRKLVVTIPSRGEIVTMDAQAVLDLPPGAFDDCPIERRVELEVALPSDPVEQQLPDDLAVEDPSCGPQVRLHTPPRGDFEPRPSDLATTRERWYLSDYDAPVVHVLDASDVCQLEELEPLLPVSFLDPGQVITTRRVAVSPETTAGRRYVYAIDDSPSDSAGSIMAFDVSRDSEQRTPIVRPRSDYVTVEPPDRIQFDQEVRDVEFAAQAVPVANGDDVAIAGEMCDPDPTISPNSPGALYRPSDGDGARPANLRGTFAFAILHSGFVSVIDVEDLDAPCRRPAQSNASDVVDYRGCVNDPREEPYEDDGTLTVSDEFSCNIVEPHRARAATYFHDESLGTAPFLRSFPQLRAEDGTSLAVDQTDRGRQHPRLLGVNFTPDEDDARVLVGATTYENDPEAAARLTLDPAVSERNSVVLPFVEPRAYSGTTLTTVTFEGVVRGLSDSPFAIVDAAEAGLPNDAAAHSTYGVFSGGLSAGFCEAGVEDRSVMRQRGAELMSEPTEAELEEFALRHGDYAEITAELLDDDDPYWRESPGRSCGAEYQSESGGIRGRSVCELFFGTAELPDRHRELSVVGAFNDRLVVEPREFSSRAEREAVLDLVQCCFPAGVEFRVRAGQHWVVREGGRLDHQLQTNLETLACERSCSPLVQRKAGRVFELSCDGPNCATGADEEPVLGPSSFVGRADVEASIAEASRASACILDAHPEGGVRPGASGSECIFDGLTARFAVYRGQLPSERGMQFSWTTVGGFAPLSVDLFAAADFRTTTMPEKIVFVPSIKRLAIADGGSTGLFFVSLRSDDGGPGLSPIVAY